VIVFIGGDGSFISQFEPLVCDPGHSMKAPVVLGQHSPSTPLYDYLRAFPDFFATQIAFKEPQVQCCFELEAPVNIVYGLRP